MITTHANGFGSKVAINLFLFFLCKDNVFAIEIKEIPRQPECELHNQRAVMARGNLI